jgi:hypothetical protein
MLLLFLFFLLWKREFKLVATTVIATLGLFLLPFLRVGTTALTDILHLWNFYSNQYISFSENVAPRGLLERLLNVNPYISPLVVAPWLALGLWLLIAAAVGLVSLAVIAPRPLERNTRSLLEIGCITSALMLVSPLTESPYFVFLIIPWITSLLYLHEAGLARPSVRGLALGLTVLWLLLLLPRHTNGELWQHVTSAPMLLDLLITVAPAMLILVATFLLQLRVMRLASGVSTIDNTVFLVRNSPGLAADWLKDLRSWIVRLRSSTVGSTQLQRNHLAIHGAGPDTYAGRTGR